MKERDGGGGEVTVVQLKTTHSDAKEIIVARTFQSMIFFYAKNLLIRVKEGTHAYERCTIATATATVTSMRE